MKFTRLVAISVLIMCMSLPGEARRKPLPEGPGRFLCENLKLGCVMRKKPRLHAKKSTRMRLAVTKPKPVREVVKPAPVKPRGKPELLAEAKPVEPMPTKPEPKPPEPEPKPEPKVAMAIPAKPLPGTGGMGHPPPEGNGTACRAELMAMGADIEIAPETVAATACTVANPVALKSLRTPDGIVSFPGRPVLACPFAKQFATWVADIAAPVVAAHADARLAAFSTGPGFECRGRNGDSSAKMSEHASGNAIDIDALVLADKKRIAIAAVANPADPAHRALMALRVSACGYFTTVLGPGSNAAHATHYHFDLGIHGKSGNYRICE
jgi:hypothetical protein